MVYYIVSPTFKTRSKYGFLLSVDSSLTDRAPARTFDIEPSVFELLIEMVKNPASLKAWRTPVQDAFSDNRFFNALPAAHEKWKPLIQALMSSDKERLVELTGSFSLSAFDRD